MSFSRANKLKTKKEEKKKDEISKKGKVVLAYGFQENLQYQARSS